MHISNVEFYLLSSLKNRLFDIYNQEKPVSRLEDAFYMSDNESIIEKIITKETENTINNKINELLNKLTPKQRKVIYYRYVHNLKYNEIATILNLSPDSVKKIIQRAFKTMRSNANDSVDPLLLIILIAFAVNIS